MTYIIILGLILLSAIFSGLTIGCFSLDKDDLRFKAELGDVGARNIYNLRKNSNLLLCTLLLGNIAVNSALSIFLGGRTGGLEAGIISTFLIVVFGEIVPQSLFARHALYLGSKTYWLAKLFMVILWPVCYPLSFILNKFMGEESPSYYSKKELVKLIEHHEDSPHRIIDTDEERILKGALSYSDKTVGSVMTPLDKIFALRNNVVIDAETLKHINSSGRSRIPVYKDEVRKILGVLYAKDLVHHQLHGKTAEEGARKNIISVDSTQRLDDVLNLFKKTRNHLFVVKNSSGDVVGLVTIEDILEEIIGEEINDEFDKK